MAGQVLLSISALFTVAGLSGTARSVVTGASPAGAGPPSMHRAAAVAGAATRKATFGSPAVVARLDRKELQGEPDRLAWSADGRELHVRISHSDRWGNQRVWHYVVSLSPPGWKAVEQEPAWSLAYWAWKSSLAAPGTPGFQIGMESRDQIVTATGRVSGLGGSNSDPTGPGSELGPAGQAALSAARQSQRVTVVTLRAGGQLIGEFVNTTPVPGLTFGWSPPAPGLLVYSTTKRRLRTLDRDGRGAEVPGARDAFLPAWSRDGRRLAWVERKGHGDVFVKMADVLLR